LNPNLTATDAVTNLHDVLYQSFTLPKRTLRTFDGNPLDYYEFIKKVVVVKNNPNMLKCERQ